MAQLTLNWPVARNRRKKIPAWQPKPLPDDAGTHQRLLHSSVKRGTAYLVFEREGAALEKPVHEVAALYERLVSYSPLAFVNIYGLLHTDGEIELVGYFLNLRRGLQHLLAAKKRDDWDYAKRWSQANPSAIVLNAVIGEDDKGRPQLEFRPQNLFGFICAQLIQDWSGGKEYKFCKNPGCNEYFYYGPGTDHRETAQYHSKKCNLAHAYQIRKEQSK